MASDLIEVPRSTPCAYCCQVKNRRDGFPNSIEAICWQCWWDQHVDNCPRYRKARAAAKKLAKRRLAERLAKEARDELTAAKRDEG